MADREIKIQAEGKVLIGDLTEVDGATGVVLFAHGSGSSRHSSRNRMVARRLNEQGFSTLLMDLMTVEEEQVEMRGGMQRFDIGMLSDRLAAATDWLASDPGTSGLMVGYFGASTGAAAALAASVKHPNRVRAVVSRGGRPDLAGAALPAVRAATLLIVGSLDVPVIPLNEDAFAILGAQEKQLQIVPGASHLFEEPGTLEIVATMAGDWFERFLSCVPTESGAELL
jgi:putative phosphoribosyl transferase